MTCKQPFRQLLTWASSANTIRFVTQWSLTHVNACALLNSLSQTECLNIFTPLSVSCQHSYKLLGIPTSWICWSLSSRELMVSCSRFSRSSLAISCAAKAAGSTGVISLGGRRVLCTTRERCRLAKRPDRTGWVGFYSCPHCTNLLAIQHTHKHMPHTTGMGRCRHEQLVTL